MSLSMSVFSVGREGSCGSYVLTKLLLCILFLMCCGISFSVWFILPFGMLCLSAFSINPVSVLYAV
jgi:hypothetical protein